MADVQLLPTTLINQIAAGEVIERPASVVKELVENSLDAGATHVEIILQKAGRELIRVTDNGSGMTPENAHLSLERHATSKIRSFEDLTTVVSMGFRGEALPSIASISHFTLRTRTPNTDTAHEIRLEGGQIISEGPTAGDIGTSISVAHLFYNVPARRKFLKSDSTELSQCVDLVKALAIAHPQVGFRLMEGRRSLLEVSAGQDLETRLKAIFGAETITLLLPVQAQQGDDCLKGFVSPLGQYQPTRQKIFFFINSRPVDSKIFHQALREAYGLHMGPGRYPCAFLFLQLPAHQVDVNVHPAKREVRFRTEREKLTFLVQALSAVLHTSGSGAPVPFAATTPTGLPFLAPSSPPFTPQPFGLQPSTDKLTAFNTPSFPRPSVPAITQTQFRVAQAPVATHGWQFLSFLHTQYALFSTPEGLALVCLPAAQARIAFENIEAALLRAPESQNLLIPALLQIDGALSTVLKTHQKILARQGFHLAPFGQGTWRLEAIPSWLSGENGFHGSPEALLVAELHALGEMSSADESLLHQRLAHVAAQHAQVTITHTAAAVRLVDQLLSCRQPLKSPSGAPTLWHISVDELKKRFFL